MEEHIRNNDSGTHGLAHVPHANTRPGEADSNAMYVLPFAIVIGMLVLSMSIYYSAGGITSAIEAKDFSAKVNFNSPNAAAAVVPSPAAPSAPARAAPSVPSAGGCGNPAPIKNTPGEPAKLDITGRPFKGSANAKVTIVEFAEFLCPYCKKVEPTVNQVVQNYQDKVKFVYMNYNIHGAQAQKALEGAECALDQGQDKFWAYHGAMYANPTGDAAAIKTMASTIGLDTTKFNTCLDTGAKASVVSAQQAMGSAAGVSGTPTFFINGQPIVGAQPYENFKSLIDAELAK